MAVLSASVYICSLLFSLLVMDGREGKDRTTHAVYKQSGDEQISPELGPGQSLQTQTNQHQRRLHMRLDGLF